MKVIFTSNRFIDFLIRLLITAIVISPVIIWSWDTVKETTAITHKVMVPPNISGKVISVVPDGEYKIWDVLAVLEDKLGRKHNLTMAQKCQFVFLVQFVNDSQLDNL